jgi:HSP20 family protein
MAESATKLPVKKSPSPAPTGDWTPFDGLRRQIDRLFDDFHPFDWRLPSVFGAEMPRIERAAWQVAPAMDVAEKDDAYEIAAELPGLDEKDVEIKLANHILVIKGEKSDQKEEKRKDYHLSERRFGSFQRNFQLPESVDIDRIEANFAKGVLTIRLPKTAEARKAEKRIPVKAA